MAFFYNIEMLIHYLVMQNRLYIKVSLRSLDDTYKEQHYHVDTNHPPKLFPYSESKSLNRQTMHYMFASVNLSERSLLTVLFLSIHSRACVISTGWENIFLIIAGLVI